jgi:hypothetical protein
VARKLRKALAETPVERAQPAGPRAAVPATAPGAPTAPKAATAPGGLSPLHTPSWAHEPRPKTSAPQGALQTLSVPRVARIASSSEEALHSPSS